jgi:glycosyltransferase involved in cell wall biosynthesis
MRIVVDARQVYRPDRRGIGKNLVDLYAALAAHRPDWRFVLAHDRTVPDPLAGFPNVERRQIDIPGHRFNLWEQVRLPAAAVGWGADVLHAPANTGPRAPLARMVVTIHDLIPLEIAPDAPATRRWLRRVRAAARAARHVVTPSRYSKGRICEVFGVPAGKVTVVPWAPAGNLRRVDDPVELDRVRGKYGLRPGEPYAFGFGAEDPRKNTARVIDAYAGLPEAVRRAFRLLLVGVQEPALSRFRERAGPGVALHGFADEADLPALLSGAAALVFPSRSEGFGLPVLDAFRCGTPVLTADRTSLPEVAGGAAVLVDPDSTEAVRDGLCRLLTDEPLRRELATRGAERVAQFTWEKAAAAVAGVFEAVAGRLVTTR